MQRFLSIAIIICLLFNSSSAKSQINSHKTVLVLLSLSPTTPAYGGILNGLRNELDKALGESYEMHIEFLAAEQYPRGEYPKENFDVYNEKYSKLKLDLLICVGTDIVSIVKKSGDVYLLNLPTVAVDFDLSDYGIYFDMQLNVQTAAIAIKMNADSTLSGALALFPNTTSIYFISGVSKSDRVYEKMSQLAAAKLKGNRKLIFLHDMAMDDVIQVVRHLPKNSIIILTSFSADSKGVPYYNPESARLISNAANAPLFTYTDMGFGDGAVGGYQVSFHNAGAVTGKTAVKILNGVPANTIIITEKDYNETAFDMRQLKKWHIDNVADLPKGSIIKFEEITFFGKYKWFIIAGLLVLLLQSILIVKLTQMYRKQKIMTQRIQETEDKYAHLFREDRILRTGQLTASLSHELNQPLAASLSSAQAGIRFIDTGKMEPVQLKEIFQYITEDIKRAAAILGSLRGMMNLDKREKERVELNRLISEVVDLYQGKSIELKNNLQYHLPNMPVYVMADSIQIQQVIMNLISNALQAMEKTSVKNKVIAITQTVDDGYVSVSVRDRGEGIAESIKEKIFKPFVTSRKEGSGIGLAISQAIIDGHEGKIWAENMPDGGAKFTFKLKVAND